MKKSLQQIYVAWDQDRYMINTTHDVNFDFLVLNKLYGYKYITTISDYLSLAVAEKLLLQLNIEKNKALLLKRKSGFLFKFTKPKTINVIISDLKSKLEKLIRQPGKSNKIIEYINVNEEAVWPEDTEITKVLAVLNGRVLLIEEINRLLFEKGIRIKQPLVYILQFLYLMGKIEKIPAIGLLDNDEYKCNRCGSKRVLKNNCITCGPDCYYCEECLNMGEARSCETIFAVKNNQLKYNREIIINFDFRLSSAQLVAFNDIGDFIRNKTNLIGLIWAVCGAGKTEVSFSAIKEVLSRGGKVLFAIPRRDVVIELAPRLKKAFPNEDVIVLYGGSDNKFGSGDIVIATTHQTLRFYKAFDLVILDEADAYPYSGSEMLRYAVERAKKETGKLIYMSATPHKSILKKNPFCVKIPVRHHGRPLPVPNIIIKKQKNLISFEELRFLELSKDEGYQVFIFVPTVTLAERIGAYLKSVFGNEVEFSHARDKHRDNKRQRFFKGDFTFFVTTTIMERGITVPKVNVLVLFADYEKIFDDSSLIQMAGRAGRSNLFMGKVIYSAEKTTEAMRAVIRKIKDMNNEAQKRGFIVKDNNEIDN